MKNILIFILLLCLVLSLYGFLFLDGDAISFEELYKGCMNYITDIGNTFDGFRKNIITMIGNLSNPIGAIGDFFNDLWTNIANFFGQCGHGGGECPDSCSYQCNDCV